MKPRIGQRTGILLGGGAAGALAVGLEAQRRLRGAVASDPLAARLQEPPAGRPLSARSADGTTLHVELFGRESGPTIVLAHGWTEQLSYWTLVTERLADAGLRVAAYDLRGHGRSCAATGGDYSPERFGEDLEAVLEAIGDAPHRPIVAGHSLGAMSIVAWAEHHEVSARVSAAALLNTGVGDLIAESLLIPVPRIAAAVNRTPVGRGTLSVRGRLPGFSGPVNHAAIRYIAFGPTATPAQVAFYERMLIACPPDVRATIGIALCDLELRAGLPRIDVPALVLAGDRDRLTPPSHAHRIAAALPQLHELVILPETGHMSPLERPDEVTGALLGLAAAVRSQALAPRG